MYDIKWFIHGFILFPCISVKLSSSKQGCLSQCPILMPLLEDIHDLAIGDIFQPKNSKEHKRSKSFVYHSSLHIPWLCLFSATMQLGSDSWILNK